MTEQQFPVIVRESNALYDIIEIRPFEGAWAAHVSVLIEKRDDEGRPCKEVSISTNGTLDKAAAVHARQWAMAILQACDIADAK